MRGHFDLEMLDTPGLSQEVIEAVRREGGDPKVEALLREFKREGRWSTDNLLYQVDPSYFYYWAMSGPTPYGNMNSNNYAGCAMLAGVVLLTTSSEPSYNGELTQENTSIHNVSGNVGSSPGKSFGSADSTVNGPIITPEYAVEADGREAVYGKFKWLYLPGQATSSTIRSLGIYWSDNATDLNSGYAKVRVGRVRIKDSGGNPVTISKSATKSLLIEYTYRMPTL